VDDVEGLIRSTLQSVFAAGEVTTAELDDLGWAELIADDPALAVTVLFDEQGRSGASSAMLDVEVARVIGCDLGAAVIFPVAGDDFIAVSDGFATGAVVGPSSGSLVSGVVLDDGRPAVVSVALGAGREGAAEVLEARGTWRRVRFAVEGCSMAPVDVAAWSAGMAAARRAVAFELLGLGWAMLDLACAHAREREQFGRPIGSFQAVQHQLADAAVALYGAKALADESWTDARTEVTLAVKAEASTATLLAARTAQQVLGGMGFTAEHPFGALFRRALVLDRVLGTPASCYQRLAELLDAETAPAGSL